MDKNVIFNYVMETPGNTNPNVLSSLLDGLSELPDVEPNDKDKYLHTNSTDGSLEWSDGMTEA